MGCTRLHAERPPTVSRNQERDLDLRHTRYNASARLLTMRLREACREPWKPPIIPAPWEGWLYVNELHLFFLLDLLGLGSLAGRVDGEGPLICSAAAFISNMNDSRIYSRQHTAVVLLVQVVQ